MRHHAPCRTLLAALALAVPLSIARPAGAQPSQAGAGFNWDNVGQMLAAEERRGFSGTVLLVRDGEIVLSEGYGLADRERQVANTPDTLFALGSTPIDFTLVAALQLADAGKLDLDDPVSTFFNRIPPDKKPITIRHILDSSTGLPDFPDLPGVDADPDHSPLTRDQFVQRFRDAKLRFEPGEDEEHSHFAWGVLAAVVEVASGESYEDYVREHVLKPAGMTRTGFNGEQFPGETVAVGYGGRTFGETNAPPHWGPTSWLVQGSGGMVGTTGDLYRFDRAVADGTLVPNSVRDHFPSRGIFVNGDEFGFETWYNRGGDDLFYLNCNANDPANPDGYHIRRLGESLIQLVTGMRPPEPQDD